MSGIHNNFVWECNGEQILYISDPVACCLIIRDVTDLVIEVYKVLKDLQG
jgi:hypothetical protein